MGQISLLAYFSHNFNTYSKNISAFHTQKGREDRIMIATPQMVYQHPHKSIFLDFTPQKKGESNPQKLEHSPSQIRALEITSSLQMTLDYKELIEKFSSEIKTTIPHESIHYSGPQPDVSFSSGNKSQYLCTYLLTLNNKPLGELSLTRITEFEEKEMTLIEPFLRSLLYPLHNALAYKDALQLALKDPLTGIPNRAAMDDALNREIKLAHRNGSPLALVSFDLDHFKNVNDHYGHSNGDAVIKTFVRTVKRCIRETDMLCRYGGEEFTVILSHTDRNGAIRLSERIREAVEKTPFRTKELTIPITVSIGVSHLTLDDNSTSLFNKADAALYQAKTDGRNCVRFSSSWYCPVNQKKMVESVVN